MELRRYESLDSIRGICACIVALFHFHTVGNVTNIPLVRNGWMFVDFFFVLSGFVISSAYFDRIAAGFSGWRFMALRVGRIYPLHMFVLGLLVVMELVMASGWGAALTDRVAFSDGHGPSEFLAAIGLVNAVGLFDALGWNGPSWSIGAEMMAYGVFALAVALLRQRAVAFFAMTGVGAALWIALVSPDWLNTTYQLGFVRCLYGFSLGVSLHAFTTTQRIALGGHVATFAQAAVLALVLVFVTLIGDGPLTLAGPLLFTATVFVFVVSEGAVSRALRCRPLVAVGTLSYSIYLLHAVVQGRFIDLLQFVGQISGVPYTARKTGGGDIVVAPGLESDMLTLVMLAVLIGAAWLTHRWIEAPGRALSRRWVTQSIVEATGQAQRENRAPVF